MDIDEVDRAKDDASINHGSVRYSRLLCTMSR